MAEQPTASPLRRLALRIKRDLLTVWLLARDGRTPWYAKASALLIIAYVLFPLDLVPGSVDDALVLTLGVQALALMVPSSVVADCRAAASRRQVPSDEQPFWLTAPRQAVCAVSGAWYRRQLEAVASEQLQRITASSDRAALQPRYPDLYNLYRVVREREPNVVWEFGSGCSTPIIAKALADSGGGTLYSIESDARWAENTRRFIPSSVHLLHSPASLIDYNGTPAWQHALLPAELPDLIYLDGPALSPACRLAMDVLALEARWPRPFLLIVDNRHHQVEFLRDEFRGPFRYWEQGGPLGVVYRQRFFEFV